MKTIVRFALATVAGCCLSATPAQAQPSKQELSLIKSSLVKLRDSDERRDFDQARSAIFQTIANDKSRNRFAHAVLVVKLLIAVNQRIDVSQETAASKEEFSDLLSIGTGSGSDLGTFSLDNTKTRDDSEAPEVIDPEQLKKEQLQKYLPKFQVTLSRNLFVYHQKFFSGESDLKRIVDRATSDPTLRKETYDQLVAEFKTMAEKYDPLSGRLLRN